MKANELQINNFLQATQADPQAKTWQRVCLSNRKRTLQTLNHRPLTERRAATNRQGFVGLEKPTMKPVLNGTGKYPPTMGLSLKLFRHF
jgi:hypothetical protein